MVGSSDSNSDCFVIRSNTKSLKRKHDDDDNDGEDISSTEAMLRRRKELMKTMKMLPHPTGSKMAWTKSQELVILRGILEYEDERGIRHRSDWNGFYGYMKDLINESFTKRQINDKVANLRKRFRVNYKRSNDGKGISFTCTQDEEIYNFSKFIWAGDETECASSEDMQEPQQKVLVSNKAMNNKTECASSSENIQEQQQKVLVSIKDVVPCADQERGSYIRMVKKEKTFGEEDGDDDGLCVLQDVLEAGTLFQSLGKNEQNLLCQNMKNLSAQRRKELNDEWYALLDEEMKVNIKKLSFSAKLANEGNSA